VEKEGGAGIFSKPPYPDPAPYWKSTELNAIRDMSSGDVRVQPMKASAVGAK